MNLTQNSQTIKTILRYIKYTSQSGILKKSMMNIAKETGLSNATIHRSIKKLEEDGMIQVIPSRHKKRPNTIVYLGPTYNEVEVLIQKANAAAIKLTEASNEVNHVLMELQETVLLLDESDKDYIQIHS